MVGHTKWSEIKHKNKRDPHPGRNDLSGIPNVKPRTGGIKPEKIEYEFKKKKRKDLINAMQITVYSMTDAELDKKLRKEVEEAIETVLKEHKDSKALAYTIDKG